MDNSENRINDHARPAEEDSQVVSDPVVQAADSSAGPTAEKKPAGISRRTDRAADGTLPPSPYPGARGPTQPVLTARDVMESASRHKWTILAVFALVAAPAIAAIWTQVVPEFQAKAEVRVRPIIPFLVFRTEDSGAIPLYDSYVNTQVSIISSTAVLRRVLDQPQIQQTLWYKSPAKSLVQRLTGNPLAAIERLKATLSVTPRKGTEIIDLTFTDRSANDAQLILDAVLDQYVQYIGYMSNATQDKLDSQLDEQYRSLENQILGQEKIIAGIRGQLGTATPEELVSGQRVRLAEAQARLSEVRQSIEVLKWEIDRATADSNAASAEDAARQRRYYEDEEWRRFDGNVKSLRHAIDTSTLQDKHPDAIRAQKDLVFAEELLRQREGQLDEQWADRLKNTVGLSAAIGAGPGEQDDLPSLKYRLERAKYEEQLLDADLKTQQKEFEDLFSRAQLLEKEDLDLQHKRELFDAVRERQDQKNMERNVPASIEVLTRATVPSLPYNDRRTALTAMAMVLALGLGGGAAFLKDNRHRAIYAPRDLPYPMQAPFLGYIPVIRSARPSNGEVNHTLIEAIRVVRTALLSRLDAQRGTVILITSAASGTGKSTFTLLLGKSLAQTGKRVLLVDADFQRRTLTGQFKELPDKPGLIQSLRRKSASATCIFQTPTPGLSVIGAGQRGMNETVLEEIAKGAFMDCIDEMRKQYDLILLDSPAILPLADAAILAGQVDGTIMVERELVSHRADIIGALARLSSAGGRLLGTVFIGSGSHEEYT